MLAPLAFTFTAFLAGLILGALYWQQRQKSAELASRRIPNEWRLNTRPLVNSKERRVWVWLTKVMFDQQVMVKIPVTRFTSPARAEEAAQWFKLLNGLYCTFTVCNTEGRVIGCVDVPGRNGLSMGNQTLKHSLLSQCKVQYWVVEPDNLPHLTQIRTAFLGEDALHAHGEGATALDEKLRNVAVTLHAAVSRQRSHKLQSHDAAGPATHISLAPNWEVNSFLAPLDSRAAELRER